MECSGDLIIQDIFDVNIFDHKSQLCSSDKDRFKPLMSQNEFTEFDKKIEESDECNNGQFFKRTDFK